MVPLHSIATILLVLVTSTLMGMQSPNVAETNRPHGSVIERILVFSSMFWFARTSRGALARSGHEWTKEAGAWSVRATTRAFRRKDGRVIPGSIAEARYLRLGGVDQWVMIRGGTSPIRR